MLFLHELIDMFYSLDRGHDYDYKNPLLEHKMTFEPLSSERNYIYNKHVATDSCNIWDKDTRVNFFNQTDNNNGGMLIEVTQKYNEDGSPLNYGDWYDLKIGFVLGNEECDYSDEKLNGWIEIENPFERIVSAEEFMIKTCGSSYEEMGVPEFLKAFKIMLKLFGVEQVIDRKGKKKVEQRLEYIERVVRELKLKNNGNRFDVPKELTLGYLEEQTI